MLGDLLERRTRPCVSLILHSTPASPAKRQQPPAPNTCATRPGDSLIRRRCGGGVGNRCRWADRFAMSEQQQFTEQAFPAESGTLPHRPWATMPLVNGRTRKRSAAGGWSEAEVCAEELPLRERPCMEDNGAASGSSCESANSAQMSQIASQTGVLFSAG